jgi:hypothetical protein
MPLQLSRRDQDDEVVGLLKHLDQVMQVRGDNLRAVGLFAVEPDMAADRVAYAPARGRSVVGDQDCLPVVGIYRHGVIVSGAGKTGSRRPALMAGCSEHPADARIDVVVQDEAH